MSGRVWKPGDLVNLDPGRHRLMCVGSRWVNQFGSYLDTAPSADRIRPLFVIDPKDLDRLADQIDGDRCNGHVTSSTLEFSLEQYAAEPEPEPLIGPIVHAVMYRDHVMGSLCGSGAWGTPELFTAVTEHVTCPGCRQKLEGARSA